MNLKNSIFCFALLCVLTAGVSAQSAKIQLEQIDKLSGKAAETVDVELSVGPETPIEMMGDPLPARQERPEDRLEVILARELLAMGDASLTVPPQAGSAVLFRIRLPRRLNHG